jgi:hypothetical protein
MRFRFRFAESDRERYGDGSYELDVSPEGLSRVPVGLLERFEDETGMRVLGDWLTRLGSNEIKAARAYLWLSRLAAEPDWPVGFTDFTPDVVGVLTGRDFEYLGSAEGNAASPATNRATRRQSQRTSSSSSTAARRRASAS